MSTTKFVNPYKGHNDTPPGVMPVAMAERHKLSMNIPGDPSERRPHYRDHYFKQQVELLSTYRLLYHGVMEPKLASPLRMAIHSLYTPLSRTAEGREMNSDRRLNQSAGAEQGADPRKVPLKV
jgi:hypothetical protein